MVENTSRRSGDREELVAKWQSHFKTPPPKGLGAGLMARIIAFEDQAKAEDGLDAETRKLLRSAQTQMKGNSTETAKPRLSTPTCGAKLMREWNGMTHVVDVLDGGFSWQGKTYKSLSKIAKLITGAHWSGPRFFGLTGKRQNKASKLDVGNIQTPCHSRNRMPSSQSVGDAHLMNIYEARP